VTHYQVFGPDPLTSDDPTLYHIRDVTDDMTDEEKKEIYCVTSFPKDDLSHLMAGTPPDKDFSNAKPTNQVTANAFATYLEPYVRPLTEEDINFLREKVRGSDISLNYISNKC
jgi:transcriptional adapter 3